MSRIPHYTTLQKFTDKINIMVLGKIILGNIISSFIHFTGTRYIFAGIDSTGFKITYASEYYTNGAKLKRRKRFAKLSNGTADVLNQIICNVNVKRAPTTRHDNIDFKHIVTKISKIKSLSVVVADKSYDSEDNQVFVRNKLHGFSIMPPRI